MPIAEYLQQPQLSPTFGSKVCRECGETKGGDAFYADLRRKDGLSSYCRPCTIARSEAWTEANRARKNENNRLWKLANREKRDATNRRWRENNRERYLKQKREDARKRAYGREPIAERLGELDRSLP